MNKKVMSQRYERCALLLTNQSLFLFCCFCSVGISKYSQLTNNFGSHLEFIDP